MITSPRYGRLVAGVSLLVGACRGGDAPAAEAAPGSAAEAPGSAVADGRPTVAFLGTSLTAGYGIDPGEAFPALIQRKIDSAGLRFRVVNAGVSGETSAGALRRMDWVLSQASPEVLVIETGANDGLRGQDPDSLRANLEAIIALARQERSVPVLLLVGMEALPNLGPVYAERFRAVFPAVARETGIAFLPFLLEGVAGVDSLNQGDGIHPNEAGHARVAAHLWRALRPILERADAMARGEER